MAGPPKEMRRARLHREAEQARCVQGQGHVCGRDWPARWRRFWHRREHADRREKYRAGRAREVRARSAPEDLPLLARHARQCARHTRSHRQRGLSHDRQQKRTVPTQEDLMNADVLTTRVADGIAIITLGSARRIYFDQEMGDALTEALDGFAGDAKIRVVVITGGAPCYFNRHFDVGVLSDLAESLRASEREWP